MDLLPHCIEIFMSRSTAILVCALLVQSAFARQAAQPAPVTGAVARPAAPPAKQTAPVTGAIAVPAAQPAAAPVAAPAINPVSVQPPKMVASDRTLGPFQVNGQNFTFIEHCAKH
jgi:hypothetical protein